MTVGILYSVANNIYILYFFLTLLSPAKL